jgi:hypothetical protein
MECKMRRVDPFPQTERDRALIDCLKIFAQRGRAIRESTKNQTADSQQSQTGMNESEENETQTNDKGPGDI